MAWAIKEALQILQRLRSRLDNYPITDLHANEARNFLEGIENNLWALKRADNATLIMRLQFGLTNLRRELQLSEVRMPTRDVVPKRNRSSQPLTCLLWR